MEIKRIVVGPLRTNCYLVICDNEAIIIDPGDEANKILKEIGKTSLKYIVLTHYHFDHVLAAPELREKTRGEILIHEKDKNFLDFKADRYLKDGDKITIGNKTVRSYPQSDSRNSAGSLREENQNENCRTFTIWHTPGHTQGSICLLGKHEIFVGDLFFENGYGRTDLAGGSEKEMRESLEKISKILKPGIMIYPGHGNIFQYKKTNFKFSNF